MNSISPGLFDSGTGRIELDPESCISVESAWMNPEEAQYCFERMRTQVSWKHEEIIIMGKKILQPRLTAWYGDEKANYTYSGVQNLPLPWFSELGDLRDRLSAKCGVRFNSALVNLYRSGQDSMGYHSDDEQELGKNPVIASLSLGASRRFLLRPRKDNTLPKHNLDLGQGCLLIMEGATQHRYKHSVPKTKKEVGERINITFRNVRFEMGS